MRRLWNGQAVTYRGLFAGKRDRSERVALFLAVLELIKSRRIRVEGDRDDSPVRLLRKKRQGGEGT